MHTLGAKPRTQSLRSIQSSLHVSFLQLHAAHYPSYGRRFPHCKLAKLSVCEVPHCVSWWGSCVVALQSTDSCGRSSWPSELVLHAQRALKRPHYVLTCRAAYL